MSKELMIKEDIITSQYDMWY